MKYLIAFLLAASAFGQTLIAHNCYAFGSSGGTSPTYDTTGANFLYYEVSYYSSGSGFAFQDTQSSLHNTLTALNPSTAGGTGGTQQSYYAQNPAHIGSGHTLTVSGTGIYASVCVTAWSGMSTSSVFISQTAGSHTDGTNSSTTLATGSLTPTAGQRLILVGTMTGAASGSPTVSIDSSFTISDQVAYVSGTNYGAAIAYKTGTYGGSTAENPTWTLSANGDLATTMAVFSVAAASPTVVPRRHVTIGE